MRQPWPSLSLSQERLAFWVSETRTARFDSQDERDVHDAQPRERDNRRNRYRHAEELLDPDGLRRARASIRCDAARTAGTNPEVLHKLPRWRCCPPRLSPRHATVHRPTVEHLSPANALLSVMLCTSYLREQQQWIDDNGYD